MTSARCQECGAPLAADSAGRLCPACVLRTVLETPPPEGEAEPAPARPPLPRAFGPYELREEIGRGGMGVVFRARQVSLDRPVAVKLLLAGAYSSEAALRRFRLEAAAAAGLQHPNIVAIHDYGEVDGQPYYAMDLVEGGDLAAHCAHKPLAARRAAELLRVLAEAVQHAHNRNVLHRDLKPSNVLIDPGGRPRITDFGLAKILGSPEGVTLSGQMLGSPSYSAPEQAAGRFHAITAASDVYGLGALFYHLLTGRAPFLAATAAETLRLVLDHELVPPRMLNPAVPRDLETVCLKCLAQEPERRYAAAADVAADIGRALSDRPIRASPPGLLYRMRKFAARHYAGVAAAAAVFIALVTGAAFALAGYRRAIAEQARADAARYHAERLLGVVTQDLQPVLEQRSGGPEMLQMMESAVRYFDALPAAARSAETDRRHAAMLAAWARLLARARDQHAKGEEAMRAAIALWAREAARQPADAEAAAALLANEWELPAIAGDQTAEWSLPRHAEFLRRGLELAARFPQDPRVKRCVAEVSAGYATVALAYGKTADALAAAERGHALTRELVAARPNDRSLGDLTVRASQTLVAACGEARLYTRAIDLAETTLADRSAALSADPGNLRLRRQVAGAARTVSGTLWPFLLARELETEKIAREHFRALVERDPDDRESRVLFVMSHAVECRQTFTLGFNLENARTLQREFDALLEPFGDIRDLCGVAEARVNARLALALQAAMAGDATLARAELAEAARRFEPWHGWMPRDAVQYPLARARFLQQCGLVHWWLQDWPALARDAAAAEVVIEAGRRQHPADLELRVRQNMARCALAIASIAEGRPGEGIAGLEAVVPELRDRDQPAPWLPWPEKNFWRKCGQVALFEALVGSGQREKARQLGDALLFGPIWNIIEPWPAVQLQFEARLLLAYVDLLEATEAPLRIALLDRAAAALAQIGGQGIQVPLVAEVRAGIEARLSRVPAESGPALFAAEAARIDQTSPAELAVRVAAMMAADRAAWHPGINLSAVRSAPARERQRSIRDSCRALAERYPESAGARFLLARTYRMECYVQFALEGKVEAAREAFRLYDAQLAPFTAAPGFEVVGPERMLNRLCLSQLAAAAGAPAEAEGELADAQRLRDECLARLPEHSAERWSLRTRFLQEAAWTTWWRRDWTALGRTAAELMAEAETGRRDFGSAADFESRLAYGRAFAALAVHGQSRWAEAVPLLGRAAAELRPRPFGEGTWDHMILVWEIEDALVDAVQRTGAPADARKLAETFLAVAAKPVPNVPTAWRTYRHLAELQIILAGLLDPGRPEEAMRRAELLNGASRLLNPANLEDRMTVDVREALDRIAALRGAVAYEDPRGRPADGRFSGGTP